MSSSTSFSSEPVTPAARIAAQGICKRFPGVLALDQVSLQIHPGEVLAVVGENGAGKSTLMRVLAGNQRPDQGQLYVDGVAQTFHAASDAIDAGIVLIHQELNLADNLTLAENIVLGREPQRWGWIQRSQTREIAAHWLAKVGLSLDPSTSLRDLSVGQKQLVEIAKALATQARVLIMDEPTSSLSQQESERLFLLVDELRRTGVSIVYISHRLGEVLRLADRVEVLRDGRNAGSLEGASIQHDAMVRLMIGRDARPLSKPVRNEQGKVRLRVDQLVVALPTDTKPRPPVSFVARGGEILVIAGLVGAGRSELLETIFGVRQSNGGKVQIDTHELARHGVRTSIANGLALVTEDRKATGLLVESSVRVNTTLAALPHNPASPLVKPRWEAGQTDRLINALGIKTASQNTAVTTLSGGNQQKIAIAKWLIEPPKVLLLDEPTRGVDIAARQEIYNILLKLIEEQVAVVIVSSDMEEVIAIADRVLVMHEGSLGGELVGEQITENNIMQLAVGKRLSEPQPSESVSCEANT